MTDISPRTRVKHQCNHVGRPTCYILCQGERMNFNRFVDVRKSKHFSFFFCQKMP